MHAQHAQEARIGAGMAPRPISVLVQGKPEAGPPAPAARPTPAEDHAAAGVDVGPPLQQQLHGLADLAAMALLGGL